jgi:hypothetical protein
MRPPGWFVDARAVLLVALLAVTSLLLAAGSGLAWRQADRAKRQWVAARDSMETLLSGNWVRIGPWDKVVVGRAPDSLPRTAR